MAFSTKSFAALTLIALLSACAGVVTSPSTGETPITKAFTTRVLGWRQQDSITTFYFLARENAGQTEVCGAVYTDGLQRIRALEPQILIKTSMETQDELILNKIQSFKRLKSFDETSTANCVMTQRPWTDDLAQAPLRLRFRFTQISL